MGFTEPDSAPVAPPQMPQASMPGIAPAPYAGPDETAGVITYSATGVTWNLPGQDVMGGVDGNKVQESGYAHDVSAGLVSPYSPGQVSPVRMPGDVAGAASDDMSATVAGAVENATGRYLEHEGDTHAIGSTIGDVMSLPPGPPDPGAAPGEAAPTGAYYDPPRSY